MLLIPLVFVVVLIASIFIASRTFKALVADGRTSAWILSILVFLISFAVLGLATGYLILENVRIER